jgi:hypothetical protein
MLPMRTAQMVQGQSLTPPKVGGEQLPGLSIAGQVPVADQKTVF